LSAVAHFTKVDQPSFAPLADHLFHIIASATLTSGSLEITSVTDSGLIP
jgi:hypothetical protein